MEHTCKCGVTRTLGENQERGLKPGVEPCKRCAAWVQGLKEPPKYPKRLPKKEKKKKRKKPESKCDLCKAVLSPHGKIIRWMGRRWKICPGCLRNSAILGDVMGTTVMLERIPPKDGTECAEEGCKERKPAYRATIMIKRSEYRILICKYHMKHMALNGATWQGKGDGDGGAERRETDGRSSIGF